MIKDKVKETFKIEIWLKLIRPFRYHDVIEIKNKQINFGKNPICRSEFMG